MFPIPRDDTEQDEAQSCSFVISPGWWARNSLGAVYSRKVDGKMREGGETNRGLEIYCWSHVHLVNTPPSSPPLFFQAQKLIHTQHRPTRTRSKSSQTALPTQHSTVCSMTRGRHTTRRAAFAKANSSSTASSLANTATLRGVHALATRSPPTRPTKHGRTKDPGRTGLFYAPGGGTRGRLVAVSALDNPSRVQGLQYLSSSNARTRSNDRSIRRRRLVSPSCSS